MIGIMDTFIFRGFASDNNAGIHPLLLEAIQEANKGHVIAYGDDPYTGNAVRTIKSYFGREAEVYFVLTGTGANVLGLSSLTESFHGVICAETAHINVDECGATEKFCNCKLLTVHSEDGKLTPALIKRHLHGFGFEHHVQPKVISISQPTEMGTVYTPEEIRSLSVLAKQYQMFLHMDGARLANAAVSLNLDFKSFTGDAGVDVLSFGGTKNGMLLGNRSSSSGLNWLRISNTCGNKACNWPPKCDISALSFILISTAISGRLMQRMPTRWPDCYSAKQASCRVSELRKKLRPMRFSP